MGQGQGFAYDGSKVLVKHFAHGGTGSGNSSSNPLPIADGDIWAIPAKTLIKNVWVVIDTAITGTTALTIGDDDDPDGFVLDLVGGFSTPGLYSWDAKTAGPYLRIETAGATDAADIYVVPAAKYYSAAGKEVKLDATTASTAGAFRVFIEYEYYGE